MATPVKATAAICASPSITLGKLAVLEGWECKAATGDATSPVDNALLVFAYDADRATLAALYDSKTEAVAAALAHADTLTMDAFTARLNAAFKALAAAYGVLPAEDLNQQVSASGDIPDTTAKKNDSATGT